MFKLTKKDWESFRIIETLAKILNTENRFIGFAGNKDRNAVTSQYISIYKIPRERIEKVKIKGISLLFVGYSDKRINLGDLDGNNFKITIRDLPKKTKTPKLFQFENYFDEQRFGNKSNTHLVGKAIIKRDFKKACELLDINAGKNYISELRKKSTKLLRFYISAYQSYLWNKTLSKVLSKNKNIVKKHYSFGEIVFTKNKLKNFKISLVNFDASLSKEAERILKEESI